MFCPTCGKEIPDASGFCLSCGKPIAAVAPVAAPPEQKKSGALTVIGIALLGLVLVVVLISKLTGSSASAPLPAQQPAHVSVPMSNKVFTGQVVVTAGGYVTSKFTVAPGMQNFHVSGHFNASGGSGNDIQVVLADEDEFQNWINGHQAKVFYSTEKVTTGRLDVGPLAPGRYVLVLSNKFSVFTSKYVFAEIDANWTVQQ